METLPASVFSGCPLYLDHGDYLFYILGTPFSKVVFLTIHLIQGLKNENLYWLEHTIIIKNYFMKQ